MAGLEGALAFDDQIGGSARRTPVSGRVWGAPGDPAMVYVLGLPQRDNALQKDFGQENLLARAMVDRVDPYRPIRDLAAHYPSPTGLLNKPFPTPHPPTVGALFMPFLLVDYPTAVQV